MSETKPAIAIIGAGIAGLSAAWLLRDRYAVTLYEAQARAGGHADTQFVTLDGARVAVDTGFVMFNDRSYPNLSGFFSALGVPWRSSQMSFGVSSAHAKLEYSCGGLGNLLAQPSNLFRSRFWRMLLDMVRFSRQAPAVLKGDCSQSLGEYLAANRYGSGFIEDYILPMGASIWCASVDGIKSVPAREFIRFFRDHGLLQLRSQPKWRSVDGGSKTYVDRVLRDLGGDVLLSAEVRKVRRVEEGVAVEALRQDLPHEAVYSQVIFACHADQALALMEDPTPREAAVLGAIRFHENSAVLHQDTATMPRRRRAWSGWNYLSFDEEDHKHAICVTFWMNMLQGIKTRQPLLVSMNPYTHVDPEKVLRRKIYRHPLFEATSVRARQALSEIQGLGGIWFAGAWTGWGLHEDGIVSALRIANRLGIRAPWQG
jgi:predicted NAD/FAD-binding protein